MMTDRSTGITGPLYSDLQEAKRLDAVHDPAQRSGCRVCGIWLGPRGGWSTLAGWKLCSKCEPIVAQGLPGRTAVWRHLLEDDDIDRDLADRLTSRLGDPAFFIGRWANDAGHDHRWQHVSNDVIGTARVLVARYRSIEGPHRSPSARGCGWCGLRNSTTWTGTRGAKWSDAFHDDAHLCEHCAPHLDGRNFRDPSAIVAAVLDLDRVPMGMNLSVTPFIDSRPVDVSGTDLPWSYLGAERQALRRSFVANHPKYRTADEQREFAIAAMLVTVADAATPRALVKLGH